MTFFGITLELVEWFGEIKITIANTDTKPMTEQQREAIKNHNITKKLLNNPTIVVVTKIKPPHIPN